MTHVSAVCSTCGREWREANAMLVGARHAQLHGHSVEATQTIVVRFGGDGIDRRRELVG